MTKLFFSNFSVNERTFNIVIHTEVWYKVIFWIVFLFIFWEKILSASRRVAMWVRLDCQTIQREKLDVGAVFNDLRVSNVKWSLLDSIIIVSCWIFLLGTSNVKRSLFDNIVVISSWVSLLSIGNIKWSSLSNVIVIGCWVSFLCVSNVKWSSFGGIIIVGGWISFLGICDIKWSSFNSIVIISSWISFL